MTSKPLVIAATAAASFATALVAVPGFAEATRPVQEVFITNSSDKPVVAKLESLPAVTIAADSRPVPVDVKQITQPPPLEPLQGVFEAHVDSGEMQGSGEPLVVPDNEEWVIERVGYFSPHHSTHISSLRVSVSDFGDHDARIDVPIDPGQMTRENVQAIDHLTKLVAPPKSRVSFGGFLINAAVVDETLGISYTGTRRRIGAGG